MLQRASIDLAGAAAVLNDCRNYFKDLRSNADAHWEALLQESVNCAKEHDASCDFPVQILKKRKSRRDEGREEVECLAGKRRCKEETVIVADAVNQSLC